MDLKKQARQAAAEFYYKPSGITGVMQDWINDVADATESDIDEDVVSLSVLLMDFFARGQASVRPS